MAQGTIKAVAWSTTGPDWPAKATIQNGFLLNHSLPSPHPTPNWAHYSVLNFTTEHHDRPDWPANANALAGSWGSHITYTRVTRPQSPCYHSLYVESWTMMHFTLIKWQNVITSQVVLVLSFKFHFAYFINVVLSVNTSREELKSKIYCHFLPFLIGLYTVQLKSVYGSWGNAPARPPPQNFLELSFISFDPGQHFGIVLEQSSWHRFSAI